MFMFGFRSNRSSIDFILGLIPLSFPSSPSLCRRLGLERLPRTNNCAPLVVVGVLFSPERYGRSAHGRGIKMDPCGAEVDCWAFPSFFFPLGAWGVNVPATPALNFVVAFRRVFFCLISILLVCHKSSLFSGSLCSVSEIYQGYRGFLSPLFIFLVPRANMNPSLYDWPGLCHE